MPVSISHPQYFPFFSHHQPSVLLLSSYSLFSHSQVAITNSFFFFFLDFSSSSSFFLSLSTSLLFLSPFFFFLTFSFFSLFFFLLFFFLFLTANLEFSFSQVCNSFFASFLFSLHHQSLTAPSSLVSLLFSLQSLAFVLSTSSFHLISRITHSGPVLSPFVHCQFLMFSFSNCFPFLLTSFSVADSLSSYIPFYFSVSVSS